MKTKTTLTVSVSELAELRARIIRDKKLEEKITNQIREALLAGAVIEDDKMIAVLGAEEVATPKYDVGKAYNILTKPQLVEICIISGAKVKTLVKKGEMKPETEEFLRNGLAPKERDRKVLIQMKDGSTETEEENPYLA
jgi:hypothetical protein